jgi:hypothetical protein
MQQFSEMRYVSLHPQLCKYVYVPMNISEMSWSCLPCFAIYFILWFMYARGHIYLVFLLV